MALVHLHAPITATVWKVEVAVGDKVSKDDNLVILESMKIEIPVTSASDGIVKEIKVNEGEQVNEGDLAIVIEVES